MARRTLSLDVPALRALRPAAGTCLRWKYDLVTVERTPEAEAGEALERWVADVEEHWGPCGQLLEVDDEPVAYVVYAPPGFLPGLGDVPTAPASPDAVVMAELFWLPETGGVPALKHLLQAMAADLHGRGVVAVEAFGTHGEDADRCLVPVELLDQVGFTTHRAHGTTPRMRMELRGARTWKTEVELALERLVGAVRPASRPGLGSPAVEPGTQLVRSGPRAPSGSRPSGGRRRWSGRPRRPGRR